MERSISRPSRHDWRQQEDLVGDGDGRSDEARREYVRALLEVAKDDARNVTLAATFLLSVTLFVLKDADLSGVGSTVLGLGIAGVALIAVGAIILFWYASRVNQRRMSIARCIASSDARQARHLWADPAAGVRSSYGAWVTWGVCLSVVGLLLVVGLVAASVLGGSDLPVERGSPDSMAGTSSQS